MQKLHLKSSWEETRQKLREIDFHLTDEDLQYTPGQEDALLDRVARKIKKSPEEVRLWIESVSANSGIAG